MTEDLFGDLVGAPARHQRQPGRRRPAGLPLAVRMRPRTLDEIVGQQHLLAPGSPLRRLAAGRADVGLPLGSAGHRQDHASPSVVSRQTDSRFVELSAVTAGVKEVRAVLDQARRDLRTRPADGAVRRRGAPVLQDPAGRAAAGGGEPAGHPDRGHHREPELLGDLAAAVPVAAADPAGR